MSLKFLASQFKPVAVAESVTLFSHFSDDKLCSPKSKYVTKKEQFFFYPKCKMGIGLVATPPPSYEKKRVW